MISLTGVVLGTFVLKVRVMFSDGVAPAEGASSTSIGVEVMVAMPACCRMAR